MVFDVESIGLHGDGYAVGYVVTDRDKEYEVGLIACQPRFAHGTDEDRVWCSNNIPEIKENCTSTLEVRQVFWDKWMEWKEKGALLAADCQWPVEARLLCACIDDHKSDRAFNGPYPFIEISSVLIAKGIDPMADYPRLSNELPKHNPLADATQSARLLFEALDK